jgi:hypothetical protein
MVVGIFGKPGTIFKSWDIWGNLGQFSRAREYLDSERGERIPLYMTNDESR